MSDSLWSPKLVSSRTYSVNWSNPITFGLCYANVINNLRGGHTYTRYPQGTFANVACSTGPGPGGIGLAGTGTTTKLQWSGAGPTLNQSLGTMAAYVTNGFVLADTSNDFLLRLDDGTETSALLFFHTTAHNWGYGWYGFGTSYVTAIQSPALNTSFVAGITWNSSAPFQTCWINGISSANTSAFSTGSTAGYNLAVGNSSVSSLSWLRTPMSRIYWLAFWDRVLSDPEMVYLNENPTCIFMAADYPQFEAMPFITITSLRQSHFRFRTDGDAADSTPTWGASEDAA